MRFITALLLLLMPSVAFGVTVDCDNPGVGDYDTLQAAITAQDDGAIIIQAKGTCAESLTVDISGTDTVNRVVIENWTGNLILEGTGLTTGITISAGKDNITVQASGGYDFTIQNFEGRAIWSEATSGNTSDNITIDGLTIINNSTLASEFIVSGIYSDYGRFWTVTNNTISPVNRGAVHLFYHVSTSETHSVVSGNTITGNVSANSQIIAVQHWGSYVDILNNDITVSWTSSAIGNVSGIFCEDRAGLDTAEQLTNIVATGNTVLSTNDPLYGSNNGVGIIFTDCQDCTISQNEVGRWGEDGIEVDDSNTNPDSSCNILVERNYIHNIFGNEGGSTGGIEAAGTPGSESKTPECEPLIIRNNLVVFTDPTIENESGATDIRGFGSHQGGGTDGRIEYYNNTCYSSLATHQIPCFRLSGHYSVILKNNLSVSYGFYTVLLDSNTITSIESNYNSYTRIDDGDVLRVIGDADYTEEEIAAGDAFASIGEVGDNYLYSTPNFTNAPSDLSLVAGDDRIGAGVDLSGIFTNDYSGNTRSAPWDIGAYGYVSQATIFTTIGSGTTTIGSGTTAIQ